MVLLLNGGWPDAGGEHLCVPAGRTRIHSRAGSLAAVLQLSGQKEDCLLPGVGPGAQLGFAVLFQGHVPVPLLVFAGQVGVVVVLLQLLQEVTFVCYGGLRATTAEGSFCWSGNGFACRRLSTHRAVQSSLVIHGQIQSGLCASDHHDTPVNSFKL